MAWAFELPTPKELILTLFGEFSGHEIAFLKALTLLPTKSILGLGLRNVGLPRMTLCSMDNTAFRSAELPAAGSEWPILLLIEPIISGLSAGRVAAKTEPAP